MGHYLWEIEQAQERDRLMRASVPAKDAEIAHMKAEIERLTVNIDAAYELWCEADSPGRLADEMAMRLRGVGAEGAKP